MITPKNKYKEFPCRVLGTAGSNAACSSFLGVLSMLISEFIEFDSLVLDHLHKYYELYVSKCPGAKSFNYWLSCVLVNRFIDLGILTEFGLPNNFIFPPEIYSNVSPYPSSEQFMNKVEDNA